MTSEISNPFSTGGGGQFFEAKVQASFLLLMLVGGRVPCLPSGDVQSVRLQAKQAGADTDDVVVTIRTELGTEHRLLAQIKHRAVVSNSDKEFNDSLAAAWSDFNNPNAFERNRDAIALITGPQSARALQHVRPLLDWARTSATAEEFIDKVETAQFSSEEKRGYLQVFRNVLADIDGAAPADDMLWQFLRHFYMLSFDFDVQASKDEAAALTVLGLARSSSSELDSQAVWEGLVIRAQEWNKTAGTFIPSDFPLRLRQAIQSGRSMAQRDAVLRLREHTSLVMGTILTELAPGMHFPRTALLDEMAGAVESGRVVVVQGAPGSGKSAIVKMLLETLPNGIIPFAFKAQEFDYPHIHQFLTSMGIGLSLFQLRSEFSLLPRKLLLVDGAERLFELGTHEAFRHLLEDMKGDVSWTVVITCREASAQLLKEHLLAQWGSDVITVTIPPLSDEELRWVVEQAPQLAALIANQRLNGLLRIPFILSLALKIFPSSTSNTEISDIDERQFKAIVWRDYVERSSSSKGGLPLKRKQCFLLVSVRRARRMTLFVSPEDLDPEALQALTDDGILVKSDSGGVAPAHDVLEDWAVSRFIAQEFEAKAGDPPQFFQAVGAEPAMRRGFRLWLSESLAPSDSNTVMDFVLSVFQHPDVQPVWRDEIAVAILQSENAGSFIKRSETSLLSENKALYKRLVRILRTACKGPDETLLGSLGLQAFRSHRVLGSVFVMPTGSGWRELILFTHRNLAAFDLQDAQTIIGLLTDWAQGSGTSDPLPIEAQAVAHICLKYWSLLTVPNLYANGLEFKFLKILFKIPHAVPDEVVALIRSALKSEFRDEYHSRTLLEHVTKSMECQPLCKHFPDLVIEVAETTWRLRQEDRSSYRSHPDVDEAFGFVSWAHFNYFPPSALQGPFMFLLSWHPRIAIDFIVRLANEAALSYSQSRFSNEVTDVLLPIAANSKSLLASPRLWGLYRGMMTGPQVLECALMSLEAWLLGKAERGDNIREYFAHILETSSSVATMAVLASVAVAHPLAVSEEALPLLGIRKFYEWDFQRSIQEQSHITDLRSLLGAPTGGFAELHYKERKDSADRPHRKSSLEELAVRLQLTQLRDRVRAILDQFSAALPPDKDQSKDDKNWRIALHRMDLRHFKPQPGEEPGQVILAPEEPAADLRQYIAETEEKLAPINRRLRLASWGMLRFRREAQSSGAFPDWRDALDEAQAIRREPPPPTDESSLGMSGPSFVAAYLIRDHGKELTPSELEWCRRTVIEEVLLKDADRSRDNSISRDSLDGSRPCALVLSLLLGVPTDERARDEVIQCLAVAATHAVEEVRAYAASGIRNWLWDIDPDLAKACVSGLCELAGAKNRIREEWRKRKVSVKFPEGEMWSALEMIRSHIVKRQTAVLLNVTEINLETHDSRELTRALNMIGSDTRDPELSAFIMACLSALLSQAEGDEAWQSRSHGDYEFQREFAIYFARFALARSVPEAEQIAEILRGCVDRCPKFLADLLEQLPYEEDRVHSGGVFWTIWRSISQPIFGHPLLRGSTSHIWHYEEMRRLVRILFFADLKWKEGVKEWAPASANKDFIEMAASAVGNTPAGFGALLSLLISVGRVFFPDAVTWLAEAIERAEGRDLLSDLNAQFDLEVSLRNVCYGFGTEVRQRPNLHHAVILLLDRLVGRGSYSGFRLRDYMVAPLPAYS